MNELVRAFERFLGRDLVFIFAGVVPMLCLSRVFGIGVCLRELVSLDHVSWVWIAFATGAAYVAGYVLQESFCLLPVSSTAIEGEPTRFIQWLFQRYQRKNWIERAFGEPEGELLAVLRLGRSRNNACADYEERLVVLMQIGTAVGPGLIVGGALLLLWWISTLFWPAEGITTVDKIAGPVLILFGSVLLTFGALKRAQLREYIFVADRLAQSTS